MLVLKKHQRQKYKEFSKEFVASMKKEFTVKLEKLLGRKKSNSVYFMNELRYQDFIKELKEVKVRTCKSYEDYKFLASYDLLEVNGRERLVQPKGETDSVKFYVTIDELFGVLHTMHLLYEHADKDVMDVQIRMKFMCSRDGESLMKLGDFTFTRLSSAGNKWSWSCYTHNSNGCEATVYTDQGRLIFARNQHNHPPTEFFV